MELFKKTRQKIGNSILAKKALKVKRKVYYPGIEQIKKIGIVWDASQTNDFPSLSRFQQKMKERNTDVRVLGFFPGKELPDQYTAIRFLTCIKKNELSYFYLPVSTEAEAFMNTRFDVLIDMNFDKVFPLFYLTSLSDARFKVGLFRSESDTSTFDLMMEIKKPVQADNYLSQVIHYLEMINSGSPAQVVNQ